MRTNTREIASEYRLSHWAQIMRRRSGSGLSIKAFCEREGFHENSYYYWQKKLRETACGQMVRGQPAPVGTDLVPRGFAELAIAKTQGPLPIQEDEQQGKIRIEMEGIKISADSEYPIEKIALLLMEVSRSC